MNIMIYCQHVLGIGHLVRTLEIARAMREHQVTLVTGGPPVSLNIPSHVRMVRLPGLRMDADFADLRPVGPDLSLEEVKIKRLACLRQLVREIRPDALLVELFPFGRNAFSFELLPLLEDIRRGLLPAYRIICSVRDILVEKKERQKYEQRVLDRLNSLFDALLVHGDPEVISLDDTFGRMKDIRIPVIYTGYVSRRADPGQAARLRNRLPGLPARKLIVVSAGGGSVGCRLLKIAVQAYPRLASSAVMVVFTGPYLDEAAYGELKQNAQPGLFIKRFSSHFPSWLAAADLSISMGGYNTAMDVLASSTPALIFPFAQNREQALRCERLARLVSLRQLTEAELSPGMLAAIIQETMSATPADRSRIKLRLDGAQFTAAWLTEWLREKNK